MAPTPSAQIEPSDHGDATPFSTPHFGRSFRRNSSMSLLPSFSSNSSSNGSFSFLEDTPFSPCRTPVTRFSGVPFSWERIPRNTKPIKKIPNRQFHAATVHLLQDFIYKKKNSSERFNDSNPKISKKNPVVACLPGVPEEHRRIQVNQGCIVQEIERVYPPENQTQFAMAYYVMNYPKLRIWEFVEYSKMIYLKASFASS